MIHSRTKILTLALSKQGPPVHLYVLLRGRPPAIVRAYYSGNTCPSGQASNAHKVKKMDAVPEPRVTRRCHGGIAHSRGDGVDGCLARIFADFSNGAPDSDAYPGSGGLKRSSTSTW